MKHLEYEWTVNLVFVLLFGAPVDIVGGGVGIETHGSVCSFK